MIPGDMYAERHEWWRRQSIRGVTVFGKPDVWFYAGGERGIWLRLVYPPRRYSPPCSYAWYQGLPLPPPRPKDHEVNP